jgi:hypothetical protein
MILPISLFAFLFSANSASSVTGACSDPVGVLLSLFFSSLFLSTLVYDNIGLSQLSVPSAAPLLPPC